MKEKYFDGPIISQTAEYFLEAIKPVRKKGFEGLDMNHAALLVLDMQDYFLKEDSHAFIPSAPAIVSNIRNLQNLFLRNGLLVVQTRHVNTPGDSGKMKDWWGNLMARENPLTQISPLLKENRAQVLEKSQYDAFYHTGLPDMLSAQKIQQVVITGVMTHLCCESTARSAFVHGLDVFFVVDGTATWNREFHLASLRNLSHGFAVPVLTREIISSFSGGESHAP